MKGYVKLKDNTGSFLIGSQGIAINRSQIKKVELDEMVSAAIRAGALEKVTEEEYEAEVVKSKKSIAVQVEDREKAEAKLIAKKQKELDLLKVISEDNKAKAIEEAEAAEKAEKKAKAKEKAEAEAAEKAKSGK